MTDEERRSRRYESQRRYRERNKEWYRDYMRRYMAERRRQKKLDSDASQD